MNPRGTGGRKVGSGVSVGSGVGSGVGVGVNVGSGVGSGVSVGSVVSSGVGVGVGVGDTIWTVAVAEWLLTPTVTLVVPVCRAMKLRCISTPQLVYLGKVHSKLSVVPSACSMDESYWSEFE
jgi:hypothetical protein